MMIPVLPVIYAIFLFVQPAPAAAQQNAEQQQLAAIEAQSHLSWHQGDIDALAQLMTPDFHFVVMNGAVETRAEVLGEGKHAGPRGPSPLQVRSLRVEPEQVVISGPTAAVISTLHIDATARGRQLAPRMRILSVFAREEDDWKLFARSITPILGAGPQQ
jgi:ketosteroid isomerase-like protein